MHRRLAAVKICKQFNKTRTFSERPIASGTSDFQLHKFALTT